MRKVNAQPVAQLSFSFTSVGQGLLVRNKHCTSDIRVADVTADRVMLYDGSAVTFTTPGAAEKMFDILRTVNLKDVLHLEVTL